MEKFVIFSGDPRINEQKLASMFTQIFLAFFEVRITPIGGKGVVEIDGSKYDSLIKISYKPETDKVVNEIMDKFPFFSLKDDATPINMEY